MSVTGVFGEDVVHVLRRRQVPPSGASTVPATVSATRPAYSTVVQPSSSGVHSSASTPLPSTGLPSHTSTLPSTAPVPSTSTIPLGLPPTSPFFPPNNPDLLVLNYALTLEHLEAAFYVQGLARFGPQAFQQSGYTPTVHQEFTRIASHESTHVEALSGSIQGAFGQGMAVPPCTYNFEQALGSLQSFVSFAAILERTGVETYNGALHLVQNADVKTAVASIATVESRHSTFLNILTGNPLTPAPFDTPLGIRPIISLAAPFIQSCPFPLPVTPFPPITLPLRNLALTQFQPGANVPLLFNPPQGTDLQNLQCNFVAGFQQVRSPVSLTPLSQLTQLGIPMDQIDMQAVTNAAMLGVESVHGLPGENRKRRRQVMGQVGVGNVNIPTCTIPQGLQGFEQVVVFVVNQDRNVGLDDDRNVVAGPASISMVFGP
ncbi:hypothetical protein HDV05_002726 [Chytridiales sp. JEL 0842]|nr:hypothetical protein HDV05_002726 [Chytridiales sp. JEL 0842]